MGYPVAQPDHRINRPTDDLILAKHNARHPSEARHCEVNRV
jgi:hypothetical protein